MVCSGTPSTDSGMEKTGSSDGATSSALSASTTAMKINARTTVRKAQKMVAAFSNQLVMVKR